MAIRTILFIMACDTCPKPPDDTIAHKEERPVLASESHQPLNEEGTDRVGRPIPDSDIPDREEVLVREWVRRYLCQDVGSLIIFPSELMENPPSHIRQPCDPIQMV